MIQNTLACGVAGLGRQAQPGRGTIRPLPGIHRAALTHREWEKLVNLRVLERVIDPRIYAV